MSLAKKSFFSILRSPNLLFARSGVSRLVSGGSRAIRRFAPPRASSLPLPLSPTGSGAWTCRCGSGDHSTHRGDTGIHGNRYPPRPDDGHLMFDPNPLAAVRAKQDARSATHRKRCSSPRATRWCPSRKNRFRFLFHLPVLRTAIDSVRFRKPSLGGLPRDRRFAPPRASSLPLPPSPTGSGAWTYRRGPGDHSTPRRTTGIPKQVSALRRVWAPLANPNPDWLP